MFIVLTNQNMYLLNLEINIEYVLHIITCEGSMHDRKKLANKNNQEFFDKNSCALIFSILIPFSISLPISLSISLSSPFFDLHVISCDFQIKVCPSVHRKVGVCWGVPGYGAIPILCYGFFSHF